MGFLPFPSNSFTYFVKSPSSEAGVGVSVVTWALSGLRAGQVGVDSLWARQVVVSS